MATVSTFTLTYTNFKMLNDMSYAMHIDSCNQRKSDTMIWPIQTTFAMMITHDSFTAILLNHQQNVFLSLEASRSVWEDVECKLRCVKFKRVSDLRRAFLPAVRVTGSADNKTGRTWEHRRQTWERRRPAGSTSNHSRAVWGNIFFGNAAGAPGNDTYYILFNDF